MPNIQAPKILQGQQKEEFKTPEKPADDCDQQKVVPSYEKGPALRYASAPYEGQVPDGVSNRRWGQQQGRTAQKTLHQKRQAEGMARFRNGHHH